MNHASAKPSVAVLDVNETLTDMSPLRARLVDVGASGALFDAWFAATLRDGFAVTAAGGYAEFADIARHILTGRLATHRAGTSRPTPPRPPTTCATVTPADRSLGRSWRRGQNRPEVTAVRQAPCRPASHR
jgi:hypothetical protein